MIRAHRMKKESDAEDTDGDGGRARKRGRVTAHYIVHRSSGMEEDDGRRDPGREDVGTAGAGSAQGERLWRVEKEMPLRSEIRQGFRIWPQK